MDQMSLLRHEREMIPEHLREQLELAFFEVFGDYDETCDLDPIVVKRLSVIIVEAILVFIEDAKNAKH